MKINKLIIDSSDSITELCQLGIIHPTDKSAYHNENLHKHAYMAIYDLMFMNLKYKNIKLVEAGILDNMSMKCWRSYFPNAKLYGFDYDDALLEKAKNDNLNNTTYLKMDVNDKNSIINAFESTGGNFDVIIDDMFHTVHHNTLFSNVAYKYLKKGGLLILEDINEIQNIHYGFGSNHEDLYNQYLEPIKKYFSSITFIVSQHKNIYSEDLHNDKLLILSRNDLID
jgi:hypothetical protein